MENKKPYRKVRRDEMDVIGNFMATKVVGNQIEPALKLWKRKIKDSGKIEKLREKGEFLKPSVINRKKKKDAIRQNELKIKYSNE